MKQSILIKNIYNYESSNEHKRYYYESWDLIATYDNEEPKTDVFKYD